MNIPIKIKRSRGRPRKSVETPVEPEIVETSVEPEIVETSVEPEIVETSVEPEIVEISVEPEIVETSVEPEIVETQKEQIIKPVRKINKWVDHCTEVKNRNENIGKSYRDVLKIAKLDYNK
jgi:hypothetical protein